jgi:hypothetical protein
MSGVGTVPGSQTTTPTAHTGNTQGADEAGVVTTSAAGNLEGVVTQMPTKPLQPPVKTKAPELALPMVDFGDEAMVSALMEFLNGKAQNSTLKGLMEAVNQNQDKMAVQNKDRLKQIQAAAENSQKAENKSFWSKFWGVVAKVATVVASVAAIALTGGAAAPFVIAFAAYSIVSTTFSLVNDIVKMAGGKGVSWDLSFGEAAKQLAYLAGADEETANSWKTGVDLGFAIVTAVVSLASLAKGAFNLVKSGVQAVIKSTSTASKTAAEASKTATEISANTAGVASKTSKVVGQTVQGVSGATVAGASVTSGVLSLEKAEFKKMADLARANAKEILAAVTKLQKMFESDTELMQKVMEEQMAAEQFLSNLFAGIERTRAQTVNLMA